MMPRPDEERIDDGRNGGRTKDTTPYVIFACSKCTQYRYAKTTQISCKCLRCGRAHLVRKVLHSGEIVKGISAALETIKQKQNKIGGTPALRSEGDFVVARPLLPPEKSEITPSPSRKDGGYYGKFLEMLATIRDQYSEFPEHVLSMLAEDFGIPTTELISLKNRALREQTLKKGKYGMLTMKNKNKKLNQ